MLKITEHRGTEPDILTLRLEGRLAGPWVHELDGYMRALSTRADCRIVIDLTGVTFIDADGKTLLTTLWQQGATLRASGCLTRCVIDEVTGAGSNIHRME